MSQKGFLMKKLFIFFLGINTVSGMQSLTTFICKDKENVSFPNRIQREQKIELGLYSISLQLLITQITQKPSSAAISVVHYTKEEPNLVEKLKKAALACLPENLFEE
ncbi:MAG: hypothetical protein US03_C0010G0034 [candidate division TM6 bacterium GW2011_GWF2_36_131]|nr:MAG: hypothetical protein US03_C0010G0034 [candidate division TM6 bacterium GW2011_GWF2_36_131]